MLGVHHPPSLHSARPTTSLAKRASVVWRYQITPLTHPHLFPAAQAPAPSGSPSEAGLASSACSSVDEPVKDMTSYYGPSHQSTSNEHGSNGMRRPDSRYESNSSTGYSYQAYPASLHSSQPQSRVASRAASPEFQPNPSYDQKRGGANSAIHPYLQLPPTISPNGGSLTEFAAQTTCLFWFESSYTLARLEDTSYSPPPRSSLVPASVPATGFLKWVTTILSTTQVTQNVVLLALLFIRRLKNQNPTVKGKPGSEYRLLTVALMLGNKFLDDNTYTNKTWAEVSGISVGEIHVMEVEFLSHMKYNLYTTKEGWEQWHKQLANLWRFFNTRAENVSPQAKALAGRPTLQIPRALPSPPGSVNASSPYAQSSSPALPPSYSNTPHPLPHLAPPAQSASVHSMPMLDVTLPARKRSWDESAQMSAGEPPFKRAYGYDAFISSRTSTPTNVSSVSAHGNFPHLPSLPMPNLPVQASQSLQHSNFTSSLAPVSSARSATQSLPGFNWPPSGASSTPRNQETALQSTPQVFADRTFDSMSHRPSPTPVPTYSSAAAHSSSHHQLSPSYFLHQRSSPYRPVRDIHTLLGPAHSGQLQSKPQNVPQDHMYWQPLGRHNERQVGRVPYLHREAWPETNQFDGWSALQHYNMNG